MNRIKRLGLSSLAMAVVLAFMTSAMAFAGGSTDGGVSGGSCAPSWATFWGDTCHGATWKWYPIDYSQGWSDEKGSAVNSSDRNNIVISDFGNTAGGVIHNCASVGGYWRLGLDRFRVSNGQSTGGQAGLIRANQIAGYYAMGYIPYDAAHSDGTWEEVAAEFNKYKDQLGNEGYIWAAGNMSAFCAGEPVDYEEVEAQGDFTSKTTGSVGNLYVQSPDNSNIGMTFRFDQPITSHIANHSTNPSWTISRQIGSGAWKDIGSGSVALGGNGTAPATRNNAMTSVTVDIPLGTKLTVCQAIAHTARVRFVDKVFTDGHIEYGTVPTYSGWLNPSSRDCVESRHPYNFNFTPETTAQTSSVVFAGEATVISGKVTMSKKDNEPPATVSSPDTATRLIEFTIRPEYVASGDSLTGGVSGADPCAYFRGKLGGNMLACNTAKESNEVISPLNNSLSLQADTVAPDVPVGTKYCSAIAIFRANSGDGYTLSSDWAISGAACRTIAKKPNFQVWNGATFSNGEISTAQSQKVLSSQLGNTSLEGSLIFGSWDEQLVVGNASVKGFASGAALGYNGYGFGLPGGHGRTEQFRLLSPLTISNTSDTVGYAGIDANSSLLSRLHARFEPDTVQDVVYITENIVLPEGPYNSIAELSQNVIFAKKGIEIAPNVTRVDAWLVVDEGYIDTCPAFTGNTGLQASGYDGSGYRGCEQRLELNGPVFAKELRLGRTAGAGVGYDSIAPAEVFNLRADTYLWAFSEAQDFSEARTSYTRELAPRL